MLKNMKIRNKLVSGFSLVLVMLILVIGIAIGNLRALAMDMDHLSHETLPVINALWTGRRAMVSIERQIYMAAATNDPETTKQRIDTAQSDINNIKTYVLPTLEQLYQGDKEDIRKYTELMDSTIPVKERVFELMLTNKNAEGIRLLEEQYTPVFVQAAALITKMAEYSQNLADQFSAKAYEANQRALILMFLLGIVCVGGVVAICYFITKSITRPVSELERATKCLADGRLDEIDIEHHSTDELGNLADSIRGLAKSLTTIIQDEGYLLGEMAEGNFDIHAVKEASYVGDYHALIQSIRKINRSLSNVLGQINQAADQVNAGSGQVSAGAQALSQGATEQASSVEELAATINEISRQVTETANRARSAHQLTTDSGRQVEACNSQMHEMIAAMDEISDKSNEIGKIIKTIEDIASQTNILALNAAVEAARAGAAGKGFAVVADEVRSLAGKSAEASRNTSALIEGSINAVEKGTKIANETARSLEYVVDGSRQIAATVEEITSASEEQAKSIGQVTQGIDQISNVVQSNSATAEESAAASEELSGQAQMLKNLVGQFKLRSSDIHTDRPSLEKCPDTAPLM